MRVCYDHSCECNISEQSYDWGVKKRPWILDGDNHWWSLIIDDHWWQLKMITDDHWWSWWWSLITEDDGVDHWWSLINDGDNHWSLTMITDHWRSLMMINFIYVGDDLWESIMLSFSGDHHRDLLLSDNHYVLVSTLTIIVMFYLWWSSVWKNMITVTRITDSWPGTYVKHQIKELEWKNVNGGL